MNTMVTYSNNTNPFDLVLIKADDSFVIVGDTDVSDSDLSKMVNWEDVNGWTAKMNEAKVNSLIAKLKRMKLINDKLQNKSDWGGKDWHDHETVDDLIFDCLTELGD